MLTAVVLNLPEHGHMNATFPLVAELVRRGDRVIYYATEPFRERVLATGAEYRCYGDAELFRAPAHRGGLYSVMAWTMGLAERVLPQLLDELRETEPDYLLIDSMCVWGNLVRQILQLKAAMMASVFVPDERRITVDELLQQAYGHAPKEMLLAGIDALNTYLLTAQRIDLAYGCTSPNLVEFFSNRQELNVVFTSREFHLAGEHYDASYHFVGPTVGEAVDHAPSADAKPLLYVSMGTIFNALPELYRACAEAFGDGAYRVVMSTGQVDPATLGAIPSNFKVCAFAPQLDVLRRASLFLTHGGMNSVNEALWHGVPLLVYPQHGDQHLVAARVAELGAGVVLRPPDITPTRLRELADRVLNEPSFTMGAQRLAKSFHSAGGVQRAADEIVAWSRR